MNHLSRALEFALSKAWAMEPSAHSKMMGILLRHAEGTKLSEHELEAATGSAMPKRVAELDVDEKTGVATIPIHGVIAHRAGAVGRISSRVGTSVEHIRADLRAALADDRVTSILLDVDSPGGTVSGVDELAAEIREARKQKPIVAHTDSLMASASYWLASQADQVFATKSAEVGSIGVITSFLDAHRALADQGLDPVVIKSTPGKGGIQSNGSFSDADRADVQYEVDVFHTMFVEAVAAGRGVTAEQAAAMGDGRVYVGGAAKERGFIDGVSSRASVIKSLRGLAKTRAAAAAADSESERDVAPDASLNTTAEAEHMDEKDKKVPAPAGGSTNTATIGVSVSTTPLIPEAQARELAQQAQQDERTRCFRIVKASAEAQHELRNKLLADGAPLADALEALAADSRDRLAAAKTVTPTTSLAAGNSATIAGGTQASAEQARIKAMPEGPEKWRAEFGADQELQREFGGDAEAYCGWKRNEQRLAARRGE